MEATPCPIRLVFTFTLYWLTVLSLSCWVVTELTLGRTRKFIPSLSVRRFWGKRGKMEAKKGEKNLLSPIPLGRPDTQANSYPHLGTRGAGGGGGRWGEVDGNPTRSFWYVAVFRNDFTFSGKPLIFLTRWSKFYGWWRCWRLVSSPTMVAILAAILDFTENNKSG